MCYCIVGVLKEGAAASPDHFFYYYVIITMEFERHGASRSKRLEVNKVRIYALLVYFQMPSGCTYHHNHIR